MSDLQDEIAELETAEAFFEYFKVPYERQALERHRIRIMKRLGRAMAEAEANGGPLDDAELVGLYRELLTRVYRESIELGAKPKPSEPDPEAETAEPKTSFVPLTAIRGTRRDG